MYGDVKRVCWLGEKVASREKAGLSL